MNQMFSKIKLISYVVLVVLAFNSNAFGINVAGIIDKDTIWTKMNSPYKITGRIQIAEGASLTVSPGVEVNSDGYQVIQVWGVLKAIGNETSNIKFNSIYIQPVSRGTASIILEFVEFYGGSLCDRGDEFLNLELRDSKFINCEHYFRPGNTILVERNYFYNDIDRYSFLNIYNSASYAHVYNNIFNNIGLSIQPGVVLENNLIFNGLLALSGNRDGMPIIKNNSFIIDKESFEIYAYSSSLNTEIDISNNYWKITNGMSLDDMIKDRNDDLNNYAYLKYKPMLAEPHPDTPTCAPLES